MPANIPLSWPLGTNVSQSGSDREHDSSAPRSPSASDSSSLSSASSSDGFSEFETSSVEGIASAQTSTTSLRTEPFPSVTIEQPQAWIGMTVHAAQQPVSPLVQEVAVGNTGIVVPAQLSLPNLAGNTAQILLGAPSNGSVSRPVVLAPGQSPAAYFSEMRTRLFERALSAPAEKLSIKFDKPLVIDAAIRGASAQAASTNAGVLSRAFAALTRPTGQFLQTALNQSLAERSIFIPELERSGSQPVTFPGMDLKDAEQERVKEALAAAQEFGAAVADSQVRNGYYEWLSRGPSRYLFTPMLDWSKSNVALTAGWFDKFALSFYENAVRSLRDTKAESRAQAAQRSDVLARLFGLSKYVRAIDQGILDLPSMIPPVMWFGKQQNNLLQALPSEPLRFDGEFAQDNSEAVFNVQSGVKFVQTVGDIEPLSVKAQLNGSISARGLENDLALLTSTDASHQASLGLSFDASMNDAATLRAVTNARVQEMTLDLTQTLSWTPAFAETFIRAWLPEVAPLPSTLPVADEETLKAVGLEALLNAPADVLTRLTQSFDRLHMSVKGVPSDAAHALLTDTPKAATDAALHSLLMGLPTIANEAERIALHVAADSKFVASINLREANFRLNDSPYKGELPFSSMLNVQIQPGQFQIRHTKHAEPSQATPAPGQAASFASRVGAVLVTPFVWLGQLVVAVARMLAYAFVWAMGKDTSPRQKPAPDGAEVRFAPYIRVPFAKKLFGNGIPLSWLVHVRLLGKGYATYDASGTLLANDGVGAEVLENGASNLTGEIRVLGVPVYKTQNWEMLEFPLGAQMLKSSLAYWMEPARPDVPMPEWMQFGDMLVDSVDARLYPAAADASVGEAKKTRAIDVGDANAMAPGLRLARGMDPIRFHLFRDTLDRKNWITLLNHLSLDVTQHDAETNEPAARAALRGSLTGSWQRDRMGTARWTSNLVLSGEMDLFTKDQLADPWAEPFAASRLSLQAGGRVLHPAAKGHLLWLDSPESHRALLDAIGVSKQTAAFLPLSVKFELGAP